MHWWLSPHIYGLLGRRRHQWMEEERIVSKFGLSQYLIAHSVPTCSPRGLHVGRAVLLPRGCDSLTAVIHICPGLPCFAIPIVCSNRVKEGQLKQ
jgi:hypothetical protein